MAKIKTETVETIALPHFVVSVPGHSHAKRVVAAATEADAVEVYKDSMGIIALPVPALVESTDEPTWNGE